MPAKKTTPVSAVKPNRRRAKQRTRRIVKRGAAKASRNVTRVLQLDNPAHERVIAKAIALPAEFPLRLPTVDGPLTSLAALRQRGVLATNTATADLAARGFDSSGSMFVLFGQPGRFAMLTTVLSGSLPFVYAFRAPPFTLESVEYTNGISTIAANIDLGWATPLEPGRAELGPVVPVGHQSGRDFVYLETGDFLELYLTSVAGNLFSGELTPMAEVCLLTYKVYRWTGPLQAPQCVSSLNVPIIATGVSMAAALQEIYVAEASGYYSFTLSEISVTSQAVALLTPVFAYRAAFVPGRKIKIVTLNDMEPLTAGDATLATNSRVNAASALLTNTTPVLNRGGRIYAARVELNKLDELTFTELTNRKQSFSNDAAQGVYTFKEFTSAAEKFVDFTSEYQGDRHLCYDLDYDDYVHFVYIVAQALLPNEFTLTLAATVEFKSDSSRYASGVSQLAHGELVIARRHINTVPEWFYENPLHMSTLYGFAKRLGQTALKYRQPLMDAAAIAFPGSQSVASLTKMLGRLTMPVSG